MGPLTPFLSALSTLTIVPSFPDNDTSRAPYFFPLVGALLGVCLAVSFGFGLLFLPATVCALLVVGLNVFLTRGAHYDALVRAVGGAHTAMPALVTFFAVAVHAALLASVPPPTVFLLAFLAPLVSRTLPLLRDARVHVLFSAGVVCVVGALGFLLLSYAGFFAVVAAIACSVLGRSLVREARDALTPAVVPLEVCFVLVAALFTA